MRSKILFIASALATLYTVYLISYFGGAILSADSDEAVGGAIASVLVAPHMFMFLIGAIFCEKKLGCTGGCNFIFSRNIIFPFVLYVWSAYFGFRFHWLQQTKKTNITSLIENFKILPGPQRR